MGPFPLRSHWFPLRAVPFPLRASFNCLVVGLGPVAFSCQGFGGVSKNIGPQLAQNININFSVWISRGHSSSLRCNLRGHLQRCQMPDIENSRKTAEKGAEWVTVKQPKNSRKNNRNTRKTAEKQSKQLFFGCFGCFSGCFSAALP